MPLHNKKAGEVYMTEDEKRQQKAMLLLEYQEAEENLAHLREKAGKLYISIQEIATWVQKTARPNSIGGHYEDAERAKRIEANLEQYRAAMDFDGVLSTVRAISESSLRLTDLAERKKALGLK
jgi:hypothetical protein